MVACCSVGFQSISSQPSDLCRGHAACGAMLASPVRVTRRQPEPGALAVGLPRQGQLVMVVSPARHLQKRGGGAAASLGESWLSGPVPGTGLGVSRPRS
jgi:hypothetical protein